MTHTTEESLEEILKRLDEISNRLDEVRPILLNKNKPTRDNLEHLRNLYYCTICRSVFENKYYQHSGTTFMNAQKAFNEHEHSHVSGILK